MIPYPYNMVDMGGIDLAEANGTVVAGLYSKIVEAVNACGDVVLYNWKFAGIEIAPQHTSILLGSPLLINGIIQVTEEDLVTVLGIEPPPPPIEPVSPLTVISNGVYSATPPASGFNPVTVNVPEGALVRNEVPAQDEGHIGQYCIVQSFPITLNFGFTLLVVARQTDYNFNYWGTNGIVLVFVDELGNEIQSTELDNCHGWWAVQNGNFTQQDGIVSGSLNTYYEHSGKPGYFKVSMDVPLTLKLKSVKIASRINNSNFYDFWRTFSFDQWSTDRNSILNILSEENLVRADWIWNDYTVFTLPNPVEMLRIPELFLYVKTETGWVLVK